MIAYMNNALLLPLRHIYKDTFQAMQATLEVATFINEITIYS